MAPMPFLHPAVPKQLAHCRLRRKGPFRSRHGHHMLKAAMVLRLEILCEALHFFSFPNLARFGWIWCDLNKNVHGLGLSWLFFSLFELIGFYHITSHMVPRYFAIKHTVCTSCPYHLPSPGFSKVSFKAPPSTFRDRSPLRSSVKAPPSCREAPRPPVKAPPPTAPPPMPPPAAPAMAEMAEMKRRLEELQRREVDHIQEKILGFFEGNVTKGSLG